MTKAVNTKTHSDIKKLIWIERFLPIYARPYAYLMRIDRPVGVWLLLIPALWGIALADGVFNDKIPYIALFAIGSVLMRAAGCVINDLWDRDLDKMVERTKSRPLAADEISPKQAIICLIILLLLSLAILLQFNLNTVILGFLAVPLIISYPLMKRITWWPQAFLGLTFNFSALMGYSAVSGAALALPAIFLYVAGIFWTLGYDTIYAHQDKEDDALAGIKSTALKFGEHSKLWVGSFYALSLICMAGAVISAGGGYIMLLLPALHFIWQVAFWDFNDPQSALRMFKSNRELGLLALVALMV